jgi:drug/metabolite transporter (DMT)-like permease
LAVAGLRNETAEFTFAQVTAASALAWVYLTVFGSLIGFTAYVWLLQVSTPARVATYAYVNPFIAVVLGCSLGREPLSGELLSAGVLIIAAVALIVRSNTSGAPAKQLAATAPSQTVRSK